MINIDWSYAPSGATHFHKGDIMYRPHWRKSGFYCDLGLEAFGWIKDTYPSPISECIERPKKQEAWDGSGKPPIGIECEVRCNDVWSICKTLAYHQVSDTAVAVHFLDGSNSLFWCATFRPIKTAEQLAEEDRKSQIEVMHKIYMEGASEHKGGLAALYDAGYKLAK